jgi:NADPH-dependent 2,4-dienoyl-CoA reductase/sulfur reductase-like enzyme
MRNVEILIIGGGVAGTTAAETYRNGGGSGEVILVSDEAHPLYSRVLLPHAVKGQIAPEKVFLKKPEFYQDKKIELLAGRSVTAFDPTKRLATFDNGEEIVFSKAVIAIGGKPNAWDVPGADLPGAMRLQTFEDARTVAEGIGPDDRLVIIGSGFIALEFAAIAMKKDAKAILLARGERYWSSVLGPAIAASVTKALETGGVEVRSDVRAKSVIGPKKISGIELDSGEILECSKIGIGIGIGVPVGTFHDVGVDQGILTDEYLETKESGIWAAGDCAEFQNPLLGLRHIVGNWTNALAQGRHVGQALLGDRKPFSLLTSYTSNVVPGANLIFLGETRMQGGMDREEIVIEPLKKVVEIHYLAGRPVGAILLNCPEKRAELAARLSTSQS